MPCRTIQTMHRRGDVYEIKTWARSPRKTKPTQSKSSGFRSGIRKERIYPPNLELEWEPDYPQGWTGMGAGDFDKLVSTEFYKKA